MSLVKLRQPQTKFLEQYLVKNVLTEAQAASRFGIKNLRARVSELRESGLAVQTVRTKSGLRAYTISG